MQEKTQAEEIKEYAIEMYSYFYVFTMIMLGAFLTWSLNNNIMQVSIIMMAATFLYSLLAICCYNFFIKIKDEESC